MKLFQKARTGKTKWLEITTAGDTMISQHGLIGSDAVHVPTRKVCQPTNIGKANGRTPEQQAIFEADAKIVIKKKEGYLEWDDFDNKAADAAVAALTLDTLPESFCPCKPVSKCPTKVLDNPKTYGQRKWNGHCVILVKTETGIGKIYSRRMEDITEYLGNIPIVEHDLDTLPNGSMVLNEITWEDAKTGKESTRKVAKLVRVKDAEKAMSRYTEYSLTGKYVIRPFDALWWKGNFIGDSTHMERHALLTADGIVLPTIYQDWKARIFAAKQDGWEGFVLRTPDEKSRIEYTLDGKAHKSGSWKYKFLKEDDVVLVYGELGKSGRHAEVYAKFSIRQYNDAGELKDYGHCGPGILKQDELEELTRKLDNGKMSFPLVAEIEYQSRQEDSHKFEFPILQRIRIDKKPAECIFNPEE